MRKLTARQFENPLLEAVSGHRCEITGVKFRATYSIVPVSDEAWISNTALEVGKVVLWGITIPVNECNYHATQPTATYSPLGTQT